VLLLLLLVCAVGGALSPLEVPPSLSPNHPLTTIIPTTNAAVAAWQQHMGSTQWLQQLDSSSTSSSSTAAASWLQLPWLVVECYLYVRLAAIMAQQVCGDGMAGCVRGRGGGGIRREKGGNGEGLWQYNTRVRQYSARVWQYNIKAWQ
jgi:hypothetical protein